ncbi:MAG: helix-turn-helix transcriptional regulator [Sedimentisphaerales bacterium]|nr:helix-turn-helix transcriptional regulator [Sedimentisphaerales bacterium]
MYRYVRVRQPEFNAQGLLLAYQGKLYYPIIHHTAVDQDRAIGDRLTFREHVHDVYHLNIFTGGRGGYSRDGVFCEARPGTLAIISPGQPHDFVTRRGDTIYSEVTFSCETADGEHLAVPMAELLSLYTGVPLTLSDQPQLAKHLVREFVANIVQLSDYVQRQSPLSGFHAHRTLARLLDMLVTDCCVSDDDQAALTNRIYAVKDYLDRHYMEQLSIDELAQIAQLSKGYLFRAFKKTFQVPPLAYQQTLRLEAAKTLLKSTELRCNEIARRVGYDNPCFFHRLFKQRIGVPPNQYRRSSPGGVDLPDSDDE